MPTLHDEFIVQKVHNEIQRLLTEIGMSMGALNFDIVIDENDDIFILEIGPRNGGNMIPELTEYCTGVDMKTYSIRAAIGEDCRDLKMSNEKKYFSHYVIHSEKSGIVRAIDLSEKLKRHVIYKHFNFEVNDWVEVFKNSSNRLGIILLKYSSKEEMLELLDTMNSNLKLEIE
jgi:hypothetical protein